MDNSNISFGTINIETGEIQDGYIDKNGQMKYKKQPWYKRILRKPPEQIEYIGITQLYSQLIWSNKKNYFEVAVYKRFNPFNEKVYEIYSNTEQGKFSFNVDSFVKSKKLIPQ